MDKIIKNILVKIEKAGYEAYIVGGFVRDKMLGKNSYDVDICTNALPKDLVNIFKIKQNTNEYGGFNMKIKKYNIDITTYRKEKKYDGRKPVEIEYINNLLEDIKRRDFTINSLCIDKNENMIDLLDGKIDLDNKLIRIVGNVNQKFTEDPLRMLRAIRFASILDFEIEQDTYEGLLKNASLISTLSSERIKEELNKILATPNFKKGLNYLKSTKIDEIIGLKYDDIVYVSDILGMYAQLDINKCAFTKTEEENINNIKKILRKRKIDNYVLFNYGLYLSMVAGSIMGIDNKTINNIYKNLPIKAVKDIDINGKDIMKMLNLKPCKLISDIINDVKNEILLGNLKNKKGDISKYIIGKWKHE